MRGGRTSAWSNAPRAFLVVFLVVKIFRRFSSQRLVQVDDQGMRDGVLTIRDSCYQMGRGGRKTGGGGGMAANTSKVR